MSTGGTQEKIGFAVEKNGETTFDAVNGAQSETNSNGAQIKATVPEGAVAVGHSHPNGRATMATQNVGYGDSQGLINAKLPVATFNRNRVGIRELIDGKLREQRGQSKFSFQSKIYSGPFVCRTIALGVKGASANVSGPEALISTPAGSVRLQASSQGVEMNTLNATVVGAHAGPVGYEVGISSLLTAKAIDNLDTKTTINLPGISSSWGTNKSGAGWAIGISIAKPSAALSFVRTEK